MRRSNRASSREGAMLLQAAFFLFVLLAFVALAVDLAVFYTQLADLQVAATSSAAGAALDLPGGAVATATRLAEANMPAAAHGAVLATADVEVGVWDNSTRTFTPAAVPANAVRVTTRKSQANGNAVSWLVGGIFGLTPLDLSATSTAALLPELPGAIGGTGSITMGGNATTDSYDSSAGPYDPNAAGDDGHIVADGSISLGGSAAINGNVKAGSISTGGSSTVSGSTSPLRRPLVFPSVDTTAVESDNDNDSLPLIQQGNNQVSPLDADRNFSLTGGTDYVIPSGDYYFNDLTISGQSTLTVTGPTNIYLTGDLDTSGGDVINSTEDPNSLRIFMTGGTAKLTASVDWYGLLYAPDTDVTINGSGDIYGAIIGANVTFSGTGDVHFDTSLTIGDAISGIPRRSAIVE